MCTKTTHTRHPYLLDVIKALMIPKSKEQRKKGIIYRIKRHEHERNNLGMAYDYQKTYVSDDVIQCICLGFTSQLSLGAGH